jgi:hypothetical protein
MLRQTAAASSGITGFIELIAAASISYDPSDSIALDGVRRVRSLVSPFARSNDGRRQYDLSAWIMHMLQAK